MIIVLEAEDSKHIHWSKYAALAAIAGTILPLALVLGLLVIWWYGNTIAGVVLMTVLGSLALVFIGQLSKKWGF